MKHLGLITALTATLSASSAFAANYDAPYTSYFAFGDSLTDNGKFGPGGLAPPSDGGRFTNGPTYAELIAKDFENAGKFTFNFALGGATAEDDNENVPFYSDENQVFATFNAQIAKFQSVVANFESLGGSIGNNPLISVVFGGNDLLQDLGDSFTIGTDAANAVKAGIEAIAALNPNFTNFVVGNLGDLGATPLFAQNPFAGLATATSAQFDAQLAANMDMLRDVNGLTIIDFDLANQINEIKANPGALGITEIETPCTPSFNAFTPDDNCAFDPNTGIVDIRLADTFLFADDVHPTAPVQALSAELFRTSVLEVAPVPLPAGLWLMLTGVGLLGVARHRQAAA